MRIWFSVLPFSVNYRTVARFLFLPTNVHNIYIKRSVRKSMFK